MLLGEVGRVSEMTAETGFGDRCIEEMALASDVGSMTLETAIDLTRGHMRGLRFQLVSDVVMTASAQGLGGGAEKGLVWAGVRLMASGTVSAGRSMARAASRSHSGNVVAGSAHLGSRFGEQASRLRGMRQVAGITFATRKGFVRRQIGHGFEHPLVASVAECASFRDKKLLTACMGLMTRRAGPLRYRLVDYRES